MSQDHRLAPAAAETVVLTRRENGVAEIPRPTPLTRLHYFDGKFLRADDLALEQDYLRRQVQLSNLAGGSGVVYGFDLELAAGGDALALGPGLAFDPAGRALLLPSGEVQLSIAELIAASSRLPAPTRRGRVPGVFGDCEIAAGEPAPGPRGADLYLITLGWAEALCGEEDVYGKVCAEACITSTDRPYFVEGVIVRAVPLHLATPLATSGVVALSQRHLRSLVASAYFADEALRVGSWISKAGLLQDGWCRGAQAPAGGDVPVGVLARAGTQTVFLDPWTARRERIETPPRRYWAWRMAMRPWDVFLAQVLQFQCQLQDVYGHLPEAGGDDPCRDAHRLLAEAGEALGHLTRFYREVSARLASFAAAPATSAVFELGGGGVSGASAIYERVQAARRAFSLAPVDRLLIRGGIVELPAAGYLPVVPGTVSVNRQVRSLLGEGVDLRFCVVRPDYVPHALEEAQHMERISLLAGLDDPDHKPRVDVLVPDGQIVSRERPGTSHGFATVVSYLPSTPDEGPVAQPAPTPQSLPGFAASEAAAAGRLSQQSLVAPRSPLELHGAGRTEQLAAGGGAFHFAGSSEVEESTLQRFGLAFNQIARSQSSQLFRALAAEEPAATAADPAESVPRLVNLAARAKRYASRLRAFDQPLAGDTARLSRRAFAPALAADRRVANLWLSARCEADPFSLDSGVATPVALRAVLAFPGEAAVVLDVQLRGDLRVDQDLTLPNGRRLTGRLSGLFAQSSQGGGVPDQSETQSFDLAASVVLGASGGACLFVARLTAADQSGFVLSARWEGEPLEAQVEVLYQESSGDEPLALASLRLQADDAVLDPGNTLHTVSLAALEVLGAVLQDPGFADGSARLLFPPKAAAGEELTVRATRDWVLFHRRRDRQCGTPLEAPPAAAARRYALFQLEVGSSRAGEAVRRALLGNDGAALGRYPFKAVDHVEFGAGVATLTSDPDDLRADWQPVGSGQMVIYGAIASQVETDGSGLALQRLLRVEEALAPVSPRDPEALAEVLPQVPQRFAVPGTDGAVVLITSAAETCQLVYRIQPQHRDEALSLIADDQLATLLDAVDTAGLPFVPRLGEVDFQVGTSTSELADINTVQNVWRANGAGTAEQAFVFSRTGDPEAETAAVRTARGRALVEALGGSATAPVELHEIATDVSDDCAAVTLVLPLAPETRQIAVYRVREDPNGIGQAQFFLDQNPPNLQELFNPSAALVVRLGEIPFQVGQSALDTTGAEAKNVRDNYQAAGGTGFDPSQGFVFSKLADPVAEDFALRLSRGQKITSFLSGSSAVQVKEIATAPPDPQPVVLVILPNLVSNNPTVPRLAPETAPAPEKAAPAKKPAARARTARKKA